jgi:hypothetical protein
MTNLKSLSAALLFYATVTTPLFAQDTTVLDQPTLVAHHGGALERLKSPNVYNAYAGPRTEDDWNLLNFGFSGRDRSWVGGEDPYLKGSGN